MQRETLQITAGLLRGTRGSAGQCRAGRQSNARSRRSNGRFERVHEVEHGEHRTHARGNGRPALGLEREGDERQVHGDHDPDGEPALRRAGVIYVINANYKYKYISILTKYINKLSTNSCVLCS